MVNVHRFKSRPNIIILNRKAMYCLIFSTFLYVFVLLKKRTGNIGKETHFHYSAEGTFSYKIRSIPLVIGCALHFDQNKKYKQ